jgi:hypothetical protein
MSADLFSMTIDAADVLAALERAGTDADPRVKAVAKRFASNIQAGARQRLRSQQTPSATGFIASQIVIREDRERVGYLVFVDVPADMPSNLDMWLHFGTREGQRARPYLIPAAAVEESAFRSSLIDALTDDIAARGLGE